nr:bile acid:sodium symporter [Citricoccus muralis]
MPDATAGETVRAVVVREHSTLTSENCGNGADRSWPPTKCPDRWCSSRRCPSRRSEKFSAKTSAPHSTLPPTSAIGLVLMGCMPGGTTSSLYTYFAKANPSLSVIVTVMTTLAAILLTPLLLLVYGGALAGDIEIPLGNVVVSLILLILPVVIGMAMRRWTANVDGALEVLGSVLGMVFILLLLVTWVPGNWPLLIATPWQVYVGAIALP